MGRIYFYGQYIRSSFSAEEIDCFLIFLGDLVSLLSVTLEWFSVLSLGKISLVILVHFSKLGGIDLGSLDNLDLSDSDIADWIDGGDFLGDLFLKNLTGEEIEKVGGGGLGDFLIDHIVDSFSDFLLLRGKSIVSFSLLGWGFPGESNHENSDDISITGLAVLDGLNKSSSLLNEGRELISGGVNTIEAGKSITASGLINDEFDFSPGESILVGGKIGLNSSDNSASDAILYFL